MNVMELSPYLSGIQKIPGSNLSEKFDALNRIAKKIVESKSKNQDALDLEKVPEALKPLVQVEIARLRRQPDGIVDALKSDDSVVFSRAIKVKWFFNGSIEACSTVKYYQTHILPHVSLQSRIKIIKTLGNNLDGKSDIAEKFYVSFCEMYGEKQAYPLLKSCSESFIWNRITEHGVRLYNRTVRFLFYKYPELIVKYLKLSKMSGDPFERNVKRVNLYAFSDFLPRLVKKCPKAFVELIEIHDRPFFLKLSKTRTELFLVNCTDALLKNAQLFLPVLDLKTVTKKLNEEQFKNIFTQLFPEDLKSFEFDRMLTYLEFVPEVKKLPLMLSTFEDVYKLNLLLCTEKITREALKLLPRDERTKQAKIKIEKEPSDKFHSSEISWICYLSPEESIKHIKTLIIQTFDESKRLHLVKQLLHTCYVNSDYNALLKVLKYITTRHKNEQRNFLVEILIMMTTKNPLKNLSQEHCDVIYNFLMFMHVKNQLNCYTLLQIEIVTSLIQFELKNNYSIEDKMSFLTDLFIIRSERPFNILEDNIVFEKQCLEEFLKALPTKKPNDKDYPNIELIKNVIISIYILNKHNLKAKSPFEPLSIKDFPWVLNATKKIVNENTEYNDDLLFIQKTLQEEEPDLFKELAANVKEEELLFYDLSNLLPTLRTNPEIFMRNCKYSLVTCTRLTNRLIIHEFIKSCRWYQDLPIKFAEECLKMIEKTKDAKALIILALLLEGSAFEQVITPFIPSSATIDVDPEDAKTDYQMVCSASLAFNRVNPAVSLDCILKFCVGDYVHNIINCLVNVSRRTSVAKVIPFALTLMDRPVSIKKHGIRLFCMAADVKQLRRTLIEMWRSETHQTIRTLVFSKIFDAFKSNPNNETWEMLKECLDDLKPDDKKIYVIMLELKDVVPNEYVADYVEKLFCVYRKLRNIEAEDFVFDWNYIISLLEMPNSIPALFSEEQHKDIIDNYVLDLSLPMSVLARANCYLIDSYIVTARNKLEERLNHFQDILTEIMENVNVPQSNCPTFYPANFFIHHLVCNVICYLPCDPLQDRLVSILLESFNSHLKPHDDPKTFLYLSLFTVTKGEVLAQKLAGIITETLPEWIAIFSMAFISGIAEHFYNFLKAVYYHCYGPSVLYCLDIIEGLLAFNVEEAAIFAAHFLRLNAGVPNEEFSKMVNVLKNHPNPTVISIAHDLIHRY